MATQSDIAHLLCRTEFVAKPERVAELTALSLPDAVDNILDFAPNANPQLPAHLSVDNSADRWEQYAAAYYWWVDQMLARPRPFQEKMALFWHGHFVSAVWENVDRVDHIMSQNQLYRTQALGNYRALTQAMSLEPAMLLYLSNAQNVKGTPNENFARELMELFTLGVGNYDESDVAASAKAWTGYNYSSSTGKFVYRETKHDNTIKTFFGVAKNWSGPQIIDEILQNNTAKRLIAARFITRKLWEFFAYPAPAAALVNELADVFISAGLELRPLLQAMFNRGEFYSVTARQGLVRTPTDYAVSLMHHTGQTASVLGLAWRSEQMGQALLNPPNVAGWKHNAYWLNTSAVSARATLARDLTWRLRQNGRFDNLAEMTPGAAVDHVAGLFDIYPLSDASRTALISAYQTERTIAYNWWAATNLVTSVMLTPEYHTA